MTVTTSPLYEKEDQPTSVQLYIIIYFIDYYSFRACFPKEKKPTTNIDNQMCEISPLESLVYVFFPPRDSTNLPPKPTL